MTTRGDFVSGDEAATFRMTDPRTRRPWQIYLMNEHQLSQLDQYANGICRYWDDAGKDCMILDSPSRVIALREPDGSAWSPAIAPSRIVPDEYEMLYNPAWWRASGTRNGCRLSWRIAVPVDEPLEMWSVTVVNESASPVERDLFVYAPFGLGGYCINLYRFYSANTCFVQGHTALDGRAVWVHNRTPGLPHERFHGYMAASEKPDSFETARDVFLGPSNSVFAADAIAAGRCANTHAYMGETCAAMHFKLRLAAGARKELQILVGATTGPDHIGQVAARFLAPGAVDEAVRAVEAVRRRERDRARLASAHPGLDSLASSWGKCQNRLGVLHRKGFRDVLQDSTGMSVYDPERARAGLEEVLSVQRADGPGIRAWKPYRDDMQYSDGQYWLTLAVASWLRETGDLGFLDRTLPFLDGTSATVWEHLVRGLDHLYRDRNPRGLCRIRFADWNDGLDGVGRKGEGDSTMVTQSLAMALRELRRLADATGRAVPFDERAMIAEIVAALETHTWTGEYYVRGYRDDGQRYGAPENPYGRIYLNAQAWAILGETAPRDRWDGLIRVVERDLAYEHGIHLFAPAYPAFDPFLGRVSGTLPGVYENGASYNHAAAFFLHALHHAGRPDLAWKHLAVMLPDSAANPSDRTGAEPFVLTNCIFGEQAGRRAGTSYFGWWTGTAAWVLRLIHNSLSGLAPDFAGMRACPAGIPAPMGPRAYSRLYRGTRYEVSYRPGAEPAAAADGKPVEEGALLPARPGGTVRVELVYRAR